MRRRSDLAVSLGLVLLLLAALPIVPAQETQPEEAGALSPGGSGESQQPRQDEPDGGTSVAGR